MSCSTESRPFIGATTWTVRSLLCSWGWCTRCAPESGGNGLDMELPPGTGGAAAAAGRSALGS